MSLPSGPRAGGLPSRNIRARSTERTPRPSVDRTPASAPSRSVRPQRSLASLPSASARDNSRPPPVPSARGGRERDYDSYENARDRGSTSSASSSGSSLMDRMRIRSADTTPRTSIDEDYERKSSRGPARSERGRDWSQDRTVRDDRERDEEPAPAAGAGDSLWSYVASAAGNLTVNVSKAWATNIPRHAGEETPAGEESRLTRAMRAFHLEKAQNPKDLPDWLFSEQERRPGRTRYEEPEPERTYEREREPAPRSRGLRDIYDSAASAPARSYDARAAPARMGGGDYEDNGGSGSKASNRLKALRDAKRQAVSRSASPVPEPAAERYEDAPRGGRGSPAPQSRPPPRVGLPSGPNVRPRRL